MMDLERLDEALEQARKHWGVNYRDSKVIIDAARAYRDLLANGERVEWCEAHRDALEDRSAHGTPLRCAHAELHGFDNCKFVSKLLVDYPKEAENEI